jgi:hypothetical protein
MSKKLAGFVVLLELAIAAVAQDKASILKPPKGASVAIVIFKDLECPGCTRAVTEVSGFLER